MIIVVLRDHLEKGGTFNNFWRENKTFVANPKRR